VAAGEFGVAVSLTAIGVGQRPEVPFWQREADGVPVDQV
jgi:hypothetical protein